MRRIGAFVPVILVSGCLVGPDYVRVPPAHPPTASYKEAQAAPMTPAEAAAAVFQPADPRDGAPRGPWWQVYGDPTLDRLAAEIDTANQNLKVFEANYRRARALIRQDLSALYPSISVTGAAQQTGTGGLRGSSGVATAVNRADTSQGQFSSGLTLAWEIDVWGKLRRQVESDSTAAQASEADLANARLSAQSDLAINYFGLRISDDRKRLFEATVAAYGRSMQIVQNQVNAPSPRVSTCRRRRRSTSWRARSSWPKRPTGRCWSTRSPCWLVAPRRKSASGQRRRSFPSRRSEPASPRPCWSVGPTSQVPNDAWPRPMPRSAWRRAPSIRQSRWARPSAS